MVEVELKVAEARQRDRGRGIARIDKESMKKLGVASGDVVEIVGKKRTSVAIHTAYPDDESRGITRIDSVIRGNAGTSVNGKVILRKAVVNDASSIVLAPAEIRLNVDDDFVAFAKNRLIERTFAVGNIILVMMLGHPVNFVVMDTKPDGIVKMTHETDLQIERKPPPKKREVTVMTRLTRLDLEQIDKLVGIGLFDSRSEAVAYLTHEGIAAKEETFEALSEKFKQISAIRNEARKMMQLSEITIPPLKMIKCPKCDSENPQEAKYCLKCGQELEQNNS